jgi:hypothetical protein
MRLKDLRDLIKGIRDESKGMELLNDETKGSRDESEE